MVAILKWVIIVLVVAIIQYVSMVVAEMMKAIVAEIVKTMVMTVLLQQCHPFLASQHHLIADFNWGIIMKRWWLAIMKAMVVAFGKAMFGCGRRSNVASIAFSNCFQQRRYQFCPPWLHKILKAMVVTNDCCFVSSTCHHFAAIASSNCHLWRDWGVGVGGNDYKQWLWQQMMNHRFSKHGRKWVRQ